MKRLIFLFTLVAQQCLGQTSYDYSEYDDTTYTSYGDYDDPYDFDWFMETYNKVYNSIEEEEIAQMNFYENKQEINAHNILYKSGQSTYEQGINEFADMDILTLLARNGRKSGTNTNTTTSNGTSRRKRQALPTSFSWKDLNKVTSVKNQKRCGGCYAFSSAAALESQIMIKKNKTYNLSPQQIIDCSRAAGNAGCNGGLETNSFKYIKNVGGLDRWIDYSYRGNAGTCRVKKGVLVGDISGFTHLSNLSPTEVKTKLVSIGPLCVGMYAALQSFSFYKGGIYSAPNCKSGYYNLDHAVLLVGYGTENGIDYWLIKNSWGTSWGIEGYVKIAMANNMCGICTDVSYPIYP